MSTDPGYIKRLYQDAVTATRGTGLFPEVLVTQHILESGMKLSSLARNANNFFGIKSGSRWTGPVISAPTTEFINNQPVRIGGNWKRYANRTEALRDKVDPASLFRVYATPADGLRGWVEFLQSNQRYTTAGVFAAKTPVEQFAALKRAGYATDPRYLEKLTAIYNNVKGFFF
jgi:flagellum-specific peptidoglycan hydrolase FlgJ